MVVNKNDITYLIESHIEEIASFGACSLGLFGSFVRDEATQDSDIDLLVEFSPGKKNYDNFINLAYYLENLFGRNVELITTSSLSKYLKPHIEKSVEYVSIG